MSVLPFIQNTPIEGRPLDGARIALFTGAYNHIADGVSLTLNRLVAHLEKRGATVLVFAPTIPEPPIAHEGTLDPVRSIPMPGRGEYRITLVMSPAQIRRLRAFKPDIIHVATPDLLGMQAVRVAVGMGVPIVASYHTHFSSYLNYYRMGWLEPFLWRRLRSFHRQCEHTYVPTPTIGRILQSKGITEGLRVWPRGVEMDRFHPDHRSLEWRQSLGIEDHEVVVAFVSRLVMEKGLDVFADTLDRLRLRQVPFRTLVVGEGPARADMEARMPDAVFVGHQSAGDLAQAYASADIFLFPSETETFGNVTLEAMASGLPTVCADAPGSDALVQVGSTGFLAPPRDSDTMAAHVERLVFDDALRASMGAAARAEALRYAWPSVLDRMVGYYAEILGVPVYDEVPEIDTPVAV